MPAEEFYQVHTTNLNRPPNVSTITPRKPTSSPPPGRSTPRRSPGPIFLPANIYKLLSDVAIKELKKHNANTRSIPHPKRAVNTHDTDPSPEHPPTETPTGDPTPSESPADTDLDNTEPCEAFTFDDSTLVTEVCYLLEVSWQMCHAWITHWTVSRAVLTMSRRRSTRNERTHGRDAREPLLACTRAYLAPRKPAFGS